MIEFLAPDDMEGNLQFTFFFHSISICALKNDFVFSVSEEAARTLLTIGHSALLTQTGEPSSTGKNA